MQWGDEGKGKFADLLSENFKYVARYNGGNNSGHTIIKGEDKLVTHILPSGILREDVTNLILSGCVLDPDVLLKEIEEARGLGAKVESIKNLIITEDRDWETPTEGYG